MTRAPKHGGDRPLHTFGISEDTMTTNYSRSIDLYKRHVQVAVFDDEREAVEKVRVATALLEKSPTCTW